MASADIQDEEYSYWNSCPPDIIMLIFKYLNYDSLKNCFKVNRTWRDLAIYYCDHYKLWDNLVKNCLFNSGESYKQRSKLDSRELYLNAMSWEDVSTAKRDIKDYYQGESIKHIHVCRDTIIVVCEECVKILNVTDFSIIKTLDIKCADYQETSRLLTILREPGPGEECYSLKINKKGTCRCSDGDFNHSITKSTLYTLLERECYFFDDSFTLWVYTPKCGRHLKLLGRYYGQRDTVHSISVHPTGVFVYMLNGSVLNVDKAQRNMRIQFRVNAPGWVFDITPALFDRFTVVYGTSDSHNPSIYENKLRNAKVLVFPNLSTCTLHGDLVLLGFHDGVFGVYKPSIMSTEYGGSPEVQFRIQFSDQPPITIREVEVHEANGRHVIFALIGDRIAKIELSHPMYFSEFPDESDTQD